jgi:transcriptional regulator of acetoin/glycerol metabolism
LPPALQPDALAGQTAQPADSGLASRGQALDEAEREYLISLLARNRGNVSRSARQAGLSRQGLHRLLKKHGIASGDYREPPPD